jgi:hypothetical protein
MCNGALAKNKNSRFKNEPPLRVAMTVVAVAFNKILVERFNQITGKVDIKNNAAVLDVEKQELTLGSQKQESLKFKFDFRVDYEPKIATIQLEGEVVWVDEKKNIDDALKGWKKDKKVKPEIMTPVLNAVLAKSNVEALILAKEANLPPPVQLPKVEAKAE